MLKVMLDENEAIAIIEPVDVLSKEDFDFANEIINPFIKENGRLNGIIIYTKSFPGWDSFGALIRHLKFIDNHEKKVSHVAFVTDSIAGEFAEHVASHFVSAKVKTFKFNELEDAKKWIKNS